MDDKSMSHSSGTRFLGPSWGTAMGKSKAERSSSQDQLLSKAQVGSKLTTPSKELDGVQGPSLGDCK